MPTKKRARKAPAKDDSFRDGLRRALEAEIRALADETVGAVVDRDAVRAAIERSEELVDHEVVADLVLVAARRVTAEMRRRPQSTWDHLDAGLADAVDAALDADVVLSDEAEEMIGRMMRRELITDLFTDVIHTAIVSFNKRVNPLFGGLATAMLEDQIKGFIRFFMPLVQDQATAFVVDRRNQELFSDFARSFLRELLEEPIPNLMTLATRAGETDEVDLRRRLGASVKLRGLTRELALAAWDDVYAAVRKRKIGSIVRIDEHAAWLADQTTPAVAALLERPHLRRFLESELGGTSRKSKKSKA